jgi:integrase
MMRFAQVPEFFARLGEIPSPSRLSLHLTAARSQEAIKAEWGEIDLSQSLWTVPAHRMKKRRLHKVPLSAPTLAVLEQARSLFGDAGYVFPGLTRGLPLNAGALEG